jgi:iron complex outermembrane receptor protein
MISIRLAASIGFALGTSMAATVADAAQPPGAGSGQTPSALEEITVTAQRREERLQATPVSVTAFSPETLERLQIQETRDLSNKVPNLLLYTGVANPSMVNLYMRGAGEQIGGLVTSESAVGVYIDDVYQARLGAANVDLVDIERMEVLRGPQGTLYGRNSMTGAVKIVTRSPASGESWASVGAGYGRYEHYSVNASVGGPVTDRLGASLSAQYRDQGKGWFYNRATDEWRGVRDVLSLRGKLALIGSDTVDATLTGFYTDDENDGLTPVATNSNTLLSQTGGFRTTQSPIPSSGFNKQRGGSLDVSWQLGGAKLRSITAYTKVRDHFRFDLSGGVQVSPGVFRALVDRTSFSEAEQVSQELQLLGSAAGDRLDWIVGAFYFDEDAYQTIADVINTVRIVPTIIDQGTRSYALFTQGSWKFDDRLTATAGVRYTKDRKSLQGQIATFFGSPTATSVDRDDDWSVVTPKLGLDFQATDDLLVFGSVSRGFRAGGYNGLTVANPRSFNTPFDPEKVWAYEVGMKSEWADRTFRLNVAAFYNDVSDIQQSSTIGQGATAIQNVGDVAVYGVELESTWLPVDGLELTGHLTRQKEDFKSLDPTSVAAQQGAQRLNHLPHTDASVAANYTWPLGIGGSLSVGSDVAYRSWFFSDAANAPINRTQATTLVNGRIAYETDDGRWQATLSGRNLANRDYYRIGLVLIVPNGIRFAQQPRTWMFDVRYRL